MLSKVKHPIEEKALPLPPARDLKLVKLILRYEIHSTKVWFLPTVSCLLLACRSGSCSCRHQRM